MPGAPPTYRNFHQLSWSIFLRFLRSLIGIFVRYEHSYSLQYLYIEEIVFVLCITSTKLSILYFYTRIFSVRSFKRFAWSLMVLCVLWAVICLFIVIFQCSPIKAEWEFILVLLGKAKCLPITRLIFSFEIVNVLLDVFILCLPIYMIQKLQLPTRKKIIVGSIFLLGGL